MIHQMSSWKVKNAYFPAGETVPCTFLAHDVTGKMPNSVPGMECREVKEKLEYAFKTPSEQSAHPTSKFIVPQYSDKDKGKHNTAENNMLLLIASNEKNFHQGVRRSPARPEF